MCDLFTKDRSSSTRSAIEKKRAKARHDSLGPNQPRGNGGITRSEGHVFKKPCSHPHLKKTKSTLELERPGAARVYGMLLASPHPPNSWRHLGRAALSPAALFFGLLPEPFRGPRVPAGLGVCQMT